MKLCGFDVGLDRPFFLIAGPCVVESRQMAHETAIALKEIAARVGVPFIYKSSYDKANRSSGKSFRGLGVAKGLEILADVRAKVGVPVLTDVHEVDEIADAAAAVDVLQTPAFLCRQTNFIQAFGPSDSALAGSGWVSMKRPAMPTATAARANTGTNSRCPPLTLP